MIVSFCGHGDVDYDILTKRKLAVIIEQLINLGAGEFFLGGYGNFDVLAGKVINDLKLKYPNIKSTLVIPYLQQKYDTTMYDDTVYPPLEKFPLKVAIVKRNEWMVRNSDVLVAYVKYGWGGSAKTLEYAKKKKVKIINIGSDDHCIN